MASNDQRRFLRICQGLLGTRIERTEFPGGKSRDACRLILEDGRVAFGTRRPNTQRATLEARVLKKLNAEGAPVPKVLAFNGMVLIQEDLGERRLSRLIDDVSRDEARVQDLLSAGLSSLTTIHRAAEAAGLDDNAPSIGRDEPWLQGLVDQPDAISYELGIRGPELDKRALVERIRIRKPRLIKWDARCGNAAVRDDETIAWFDWEHCGRRNRLDDLIWLLGDEFTPDRPAVEEALLERHLPAFADQFTMTEARAYIAAVGSLHSCVRLGLILQNKEDDDWWDWDYCIERDKVGVSLRGARRLCSRGQRWASWSPLTQPLVPWFNKAIEKVAKLGRAEKRGVA